MTFYRGRRPDAERLRDDKTALILWCYIDGQKVTQIARATGECVTTLNVQIARFIEKYSGQSVDRIYGHARKDLGRAALRKYSETEHNLMRRISA